MEEALHQVGVIDLRAIAISQIDNPEKRRDFNEELSISFCHITGNSSSRRRR